MDGPPPRIRRLTGLGKLEQGENRQVTDEGLIIYTKRDKGMAATRTAIARNEKKAGESVLIGRDRKKMVGEAAVGWLDLKILDWGILLDQYQVVRGRKTLYGGWFRQIHPYIQSTYVTACCSMQRMSDIALYISWRANSIISGNISGS